MNLKDLRQEDLVGLEWEDIHKLFLQAGYYEAQPWPKPFVATMVRFADPELDAELRPTVEPYLPEALRLAQRRSFHRRRQERHGTGHHADSFSFTDEMSGKWEER